MKSKHLSESIISLICCQALFLFVSFSSFCGTSFVDTSEKRLTPIYCVDRSDNVVAISFDAAWGAEKTLAILSVLENYNVKATFFLVSFWAEKYPDVVLKIKESGHEIATHSSTHPHFNSLSFDQAKNELTDSVDRISKVSGTKITYFRPPFGEYNNQLIKICNQLDILPIQWDVDSLDWKGLTATEIKNRVVKGVKSGSIILCHNNADNIVQALELFLPLLIDKGYKITTVGNTVFKQNYIIDSNGIQKSV